MTDQPTPTPATIDLEARLSQLAKDKAKLELVNRLLVGLSAVAGLDNMVEHILHLLMQTIGAANVQLYYRLADEWYCRDLYGTTRHLAELADARLVQAMAAGQPLREVTGETPYPAAAGNVATQTWIYPLISRERQVGAVCMEGMQLIDEGIFQDLHPFFVYAAIMLDNEINNFSRLAEAHRKLQDSETIYRTLFEHSPDGIQLTDPTSTKPVYFNRAIHQQLGYTRDEYAQLRVTDYEVIDDAEQIAERIVNLRESGSLSFESVYLGKDGALLPVYVSLRTITISGRLLILAIVRDISVQQHTESALRHSEERFRTIMALSPDIISIIGEAGQLLYNSPAAQAIHGYNEQEMLGLNTMSLIHPADQAEVTQVFQQVLAHPSQVHTVQYRYRNRDGSFVWMECNAINQLANPHVNGIIAISRSIQARKALEEERLKLEQQLLHAQKLESLGVLAGGIAHDFNNILTAIIGNAELALMRSGPESPVSENLRRIETAAARAADLAKQMLAYSGKGRFVIEAIDLNRLVEEMGHMLEVSISKKVVLRYALGQALPTVNVDATQIRQIVMNLVINASEAIGDRSGIIVITTGCLECSEAYLQDTWLTDQVPAGVYVFLEVADTGCGMDRETLTKIFDPFFTTKFTGRGLGMAAVLGIIRGHQGAIKVCSEPGKGSSLKVLLPAGEWPAARLDGGVTADGWRGDGVVLLVDDEETVRDIGREMLRELGFEVITAGDGQEALEQFKARHDIRLVILDLTMPHLDGGQCFSALRRLDPAVQVIMASGFDEHEVAQRFAGQGVAGFLQKPYSLVALRETIQKTETPAA